jgi:ABC-2 type transport system ATP-binding protein
MTRRTKQDTPVISLEGVRKSYGDFELGPMNLRIEPGQIVAVVGPNGSGKSTLLQMLMNLIKPSSGEVRLFGCSYPDGEVRIKRRIGYVPESSVGYHDMNARELGDFVSHWYPGWDQSLYTDLLGRLELDPYKQFGRHSKGMRRRLSFALALASSPELLLLDEPASGVDPFAREQMLDEISRFVESGAHEGGARTVVFATHQVEDVTEIADHVLLLADGEFLGLHEQDSLLDGWKAFYVEGEPQGEIPGIVSDDGGNPARLLSDSPRETAEALSARNIRVMGEGSVKLKEVLSHLVRRSRARRVA